MHPFVAAVPSYRHDLLLVAELRMLLRGKPRIWWEWRARKQTRPPLGLRIVLVKRLQHVPHLLVRALLLRSSQVACGLFVLREHVCARALLQEVLDELGICNGRRSEWERVSRRVRACTGVCGRARARGAGVG